MTKRLKIKGAWLFQGVGLFLLLLVFLWTPWGWCEETMENPQSELTYEQADGMLDQHVLATMSLDEKLKMRISLDYNEVEVSNVLRSLMWTYDLNIVIGKEVKGSVSLTLRDVSIAQALEAIVSSNELSFDIKNDIIYVAKGKKDDDEHVSEIIALNYLDAAEAMNAVRKIISQKGDIRGDAMGNRLIITDVPENVERAKELLLGMDTAPKQVLIEAKILDITSSAADTFGITWDLAFDPGRGLFGRNSSNPESFDLGFSTPSKSTDLDAGQIKVKDLTMDWINVTATIDALVKDGKAHILASPSIAVLNGQEARIIIGTRFPIVEKTLTATGTTETTTFVDIGTTLRVTPQINDNDYITLKVHPEVSSSTTSVAAGPLITTREADTVVRVKSGQTFIIGGLIRQADNSSVEKIPGLGSLPVIGHLFSRNQSSQEQVELSIFISPSILRSREEQMRMSRKELEQEAAYVNLPSVANLHLVNALLKKARALDKGEGVEAIRKDAQFQKEQALNLYQSIYTSFPESSKAPEAMYKAGMIKLEYMKDLKDAKSIFVKLISDYPYSDYALLAENEFAKIVQFQKKPKEETAPGKEASQRRRRRTER